MRAVGLPNDAGGGGGIIERFNWEGDLLWSYTYNSPTHRAHHYFQVLPNGNILILAWELKTAEEALGYGRNPELLSENELWPEEISDRTISRALKKIGFTRKKKLMVIEKGMKPKDKNSYQK